MSIQMFKSMISILISEIRNTYYNSKVQNYQNHGMTISRETYDQIRDTAIKYVDSLKCAGMAYKFSRSSKHSCIYSSTYACLIRGMYNCIESNEKIMWEKYFNEHQVEDGFFSDEYVKTNKFQNGEGWGDRHLVPHVLIAYERIGAVPKRRLAFLDHYKNERKLKEWLNNLDFNLPWGTSNRIMNLLCCMQYARDRMDEDFQSEIQMIEDYLMNKIRNDYPLWLDGNIKDIRLKYQAIKGAYHIYPELLFDEIEFEDVSRLIELIVSLQNNAGGFDMSVISTACDDIDSVDPLIRFSLANKTDVSKCLRKAFAYIMSNRNNDGGFCFSRDRNGFKYGDCIYLTSKYGESNMFGTWFRLVCLNEIFHYFDIARFNGVNISGYEQTLEQKIKKKV